MVDHDVLSSPLTISEKNCFSLHAKWDDVNGLGHYENFCWVSPDTCPGLNRLSNAQAHLGFQAKLRFVSALRAQTSTSVRLLQRLEDWTIAISWRSLGNAERSRITSKCQPYLFCSCDSGLTNILEPDCTT